jgi:glyoxylase-like metal-dependent hydrolase (beta-lactamase superfamily II)
MAGASQGGSLMVRVIQIRLGFSNAFLLLGDRPILVDTGSPGEAEHIRRALAQHGVALGDLALILHTHAHVDHAGTTRALKDLSGAPVAIHARDAELLRRGQNGVIKPFGLLGHFVKAFVVKPYAGVEPDIVIEGEMELAPYGVNARVLPTPGHTDGSISVVIEASEAIIGDVIMGGFTNGAFGAAEPGYHFFVNDLDAIHASLRKLVALAPARLYVGHGGPLPLEKVRARFAQILSQTL